MEHLCGRTDAQNHYVAEHDVAGCCARVWTRNQYKYGCDSHHVTDHKESHLGERTGRLWKPVPRLVANYQLEGPSSVVPSISHAAIPASVAGVVSGEYSCQICPMLL
jgi:hypothetical protein